MLSIAVDTARMQKLQAKFAKYPPYAIKAGLTAANDYLNTSEVKYSMYPPSQAGQPFVWSSDKQRRAFFATNGFGGGIPTVRTMNLANSGTFKVNEASFWIEYENSADYAKWVLSPSYMIIGHIKRGWKPINQFTVKLAPKIVSLFKPAAIKAWDELETFMYGGGGGL